MSSILLLEDDEELGEALCIYLQKAGYEILLAGNCRSAEIFLTEYVPDIVIADIMVTVVINRLRKKIENNMTEPVYIRNVFGVGYTFGE